MLKIRSDGRLSPPKSQKPCLEATPTRGQVASKSADPEKSKIVIIKYGIDRKSRVLVGGKIHDILKGEDIVPKRKRSPKKPSLKQVYPPKSVTASKPTHPFFLGKPGEGVGNRDKGPNNKIAEPDAPKGASKSNSPRKITTVNKLIRRESLTGIAGSADQLVEPSFQKVPKSPGFKEPLWPPQGMGHVRPSADQVGNVTPVPSKSSILRRPRKLKDASIQVQEAEDVLRPLEDLVYQERLRLIGQNAIDRSLRKPTRKIMASRELQSAVTRNIAYNPSDDERSSAHPPDVSHDLRHLATGRLYRRIAESVTAFDSFECETHDWVHKFAPKTAEDVLQPGHEVTVLRDWLKKLTISAVENRDLDISGTREPLLNSKRNCGNPKRKRGKRAEELDGFVISSDEEGDQMDEMPTVGDPQLVGQDQSVLKRSVIRAGDMAKKPGDLERSANAVVISGPHGCGKTAAVYAVAHELGFEVFEINSGSRRSGKDLLDKVGDMTKNHLVSRTHEEESKELTDDTKNMLQVAESLKRDIESGRQGTMNAFFKPKTSPNNKTTAKPRGRPPKKEISEKKPIPKTPKAQKQSLILLEEVDILFEDDKQFWITTLELISRSRRPVVMTCTDESLLPLKEMLLFAILRFSPPPETLATDYLLLMACNEGHLLSRAAVSALYRSKKRDLRASITELNCFCQMAIGDEKGGLEWMFIRPTQEGTEDQAGGKLRVVSDGTYPHGIGWLSHRFCHQDAVNSFETEAELFAETWAGWGLDIAECEDFMPLNEPGDSRTSVEERNMTKLRNLDDFCDALSAANICSPLGLRQDEGTLLDPTQPDILEKGRSNYAEGAAVLRAEPRIDQTGTSLSIAIAIRVLARRLTPHAKSLTPASITDKIPPLVGNLYAQSPTTMAHMHRLFIPLIPVNSISTFTAPSSVLASDVTPYIRSITSYDLRLEDQRRKLDELLSAARTGAGDARNAKSIRTTRASRAALEGGAKATTRRERWFHDSLDFSAVAGTGGKAWGEIGFSRMQNAVVGV